MSKRKLPHADVTTRPGVESRVMPSAFERWKPDIKAADGEDEATISILDVIGGDIFGEGVTAKRIGAALRNIGEQNVTVTINSPGGDFFEGLAIYNQLRDHPGRVNVKIIGLAASAASVIAMAGDDVMIGRAGFLMIHNAWIIMAGDRYALREAAEWLEPFDSAAADIYAARTGMDKDEITRMLDRETWIGGAEAVEQGFADDFLPSDQIAQDEGQAQGARAEVAQHKLDVILARSGVSRSERRRLIQGVKGGTQNAAPTGTHDAAVETQVESLLQQIRSI
jgi:ATP-dependent protease ClpP protease subunit